MKILIIKILALLTFFPAIATLVSASSVYGPYFIGQSTNIAGVSIYNVTSNSAWLRESGSIYGPYGTGQATNLAGVGIYNISSSSNSVLLLESPSTTISTSTTSISTSTSTSSQTTSVRTTTINTTSIPTTTAASSTVTTTVTTTAASNQSAPSGAIYVGQAITNSSLTLLFTGVFAPNSNGVSNASFDLYRNGALIDAISAAPQSSTSIRISGGTAYIYLYRLYTNYYSSKDWAQVYLGYTQQSNSSSTTSTTSTSIQSTTIVSQSRGFSTVYFRNYLNFGKFSAQVGYPGAGETEAVILYENGNLIDQRLAYPNSSYTVSAGNATITLRTGIINVSGIENYNWMQLNMSVSYGGQPAPPAPATTIYGSNTTTSTIRTTAIGNSSVRSAPSGAIYVGQAITNSSLTLLFTGISSPNSNGVSNASFDLYSQDVLVKAISLAPQSYASVRAHSGTVYVYLHLLGTNTDPSKDWAQVYLGYSPQANSSAAASISNSVEITTAESSTSIQTSIRTTTVYAQSNFTNSVSSAVNAITNSVESVFNHNATKTSATTTIPATPSHSNSTSGSSSPSQSTGTGIAQIFNSLVKFFSSI
ncbi:MAG: hypothetical protein KGH61_00365 [Candidatus Micrarchaeota archaeon]|nr:hypothetical protein [Candidatus Micrarchaeota archaeon]MDE1847390.1 hypothetical protein [Candidatus Micrarchaeota archaeon]MDE1864005.1 hypothetical protein [Candidatus Micrarchaeota archaeon]